MSYRDRAGDLYTTVEDAIVNGELKPKYRMTLVKKKAFLEHAKQNNYLEYGKTKPKVQSPPRQLAEAATKAARESGREAEASNVIDPRPKDQEKNRTNKYQLDHDVGCTGTAGSQGSDA